MLTTSPATPHPATPPGLSRAPRRRPPAASPGAGARSGEGRGCAAHKPPALCLAQAHVLLTFSHLFKKSLLLSINNLSLKTESTDTSERGTPILTCHSPPASALDALTQPFRRGRTPFSCSQLCSRPRCLLCPRGVSRCGSGIDSTRRYTARWHRHMCAVAMGAEPLLLGGRPRHAQGRRALAQPAQRSQAASVPWELVGVCGAAVSRL